MLRTKLILISIAILALLVWPQMLMAQEDTTPPVLLDFTISPVVFDTTVGQASFDWCAQAADTLSGVQSIRVVAFDFPPQTTPTNSATISFSFGTLDAEGCSTLTIPQFSPLEEYLVGVVLLDHLGNRMVYEDQSFVGQSVEDLCPIGPCRLMNQVINPGPDTDADGIPDIADNCPDDPNEDQSDMDLDLIGDECDLFPNDRDNEQAQCDQDLAEALTDLDMCLNPPPSECAPNKAACEMDDDCCSNHCKPNLTCRGN